MTIKLVRVDHRLIHGQVGFTWTKFLQADCILIASDKIVNDQLKMTAMRMAAPSGVKLVMKSIEDSATALNTGVTEKYKLLILCESVEDVYRLTQKVPSLKDINLGGMKDGENRRQISKSVHLSEEDIDLIHKMQKNDITLSVQMVPDDQAVNINKLI